MKRSRMQRCTIIVLMGFMTLPTLVAQTITITGSVRTADNNPLAARVSILRGPPATGIETHDTSANGTFSIKTSSSGIISVSASAREYASREVRLAEITSLSGLNFVLHELQMIQGQVRDTRGNSQSNVRVRIRYVDTPRLLRLDDGFSTMTNDSGTFTLKGPASGSDRFVVDALPDNWVPQSSRTLGAGAVGNTGVGGNGARQNILIQLSSKGSRIIGRVTSSSGKALTGISVIASVKVQTPRAIEGAPPGSLPVPGGGERPFGNTLSKSTKTDREGNYEIAGMPAGALGVVALKKGVRVQLRRFTSTEGETLTANFVIPN